jgi:carboxyl-terminal processing protease
MPVRNFFFIVVAFLVCYACYSVAVKNRYANLFAEAIDIVENEALHGVPSDQLFKSAMEGMLEGFDRHSRFITGDSFKSLNEDLEGEFGGVGIYFEPVPEKGVLVMAAMPGKPADLAGLQAGDIITTISGTSAADLESREIRKLMTGRLGESLTVSFERDGVSKETVLQRQTIAMQSVQGFRRLRDGQWDFIVSGYPNLAYIRLAQFDKASASEMQSVLEDLPKDVSGIILDLRGNGGGLLTAAESICDMFLKPGLTIVRIKGRKGLSVRESKSSLEPVVGEGVKLAVLIDRQSASASELVAGCLQDHDRAIIVGEQSWGKGTVQNVIPMKMGTSALKLTTYSFWRPTGPVIDRYNKDALATGKWGIYPNEGMTVEQDALDMVCMLKRMHFREISGLIPADKREQIVSVSRDNFLKRINDRDKEPEQTTDQPMPKEGRIDLLDASKDDRDELPDRKVVPEDLERDRVIEKAIELLSHVKIEKQAA